MYGCLPPRRTTSDTPTEIESSECVCVRARARVCLPLVQANSVSMAMSIFHHPSSEIHRHYKASVIFITAGNVDILFRPITLRLILPHSYGILLAETWKFKKRFCFSYTCIGLLGEILTMFNKASSFQEKCL